MKHKIIILFLLVNAVVFGQIKTPSLSPKSVSTQSVGLSEITIEYSRPSKRGRKIFGELLPFSQVWRTGANAATKISFSKPVKVNGQLLEKGSYTLLSYPNKNSWEIKWFNYSSSRWANYVKEQPLFTIQVPVNKMVSTIETLDIRLQDITLNSANLFIEWEKTRVVIPLELDEQKEILKSIDKTLSGPSNNDYFRAAVYLHETKTDLKKALSYVQKVTSSNKALFFQVTREALILKDLNRKSEALDSAKRALALSEKAKNDDFIRINAKLIRELQ